MITRLPNTLLNISTVREQSPEEHKDETEDDKRIHKLGDASPAASAAECANSSEI